MFLDSSRYARVPQDTVETRDGRGVAAIRLRRLPPTRGEPYQVKDGDRLDLLAEARFADGTRFWHIADANTALEADELTGDVLDTIQLPRS